VSAGVPKKRLRSLNMVGVWWGETDSGMGAAEGADYGFMRRIKATGGIEVGDAIAFAAVDVIGCKLEGAVGLLEGGEEVRLRLDCRQKAAGFFITFTAFCLFAYDCVCFIGGAKDFATRSIF